MVNVYQHNKCTGNCHNEAEERLAPAFIPCVCCIQVHHALLLPQTILLPLHIECKSCPKTPSKCQRSSCSLHPTAAWFQNAQRRARAVVRVMRNIKRRPRAGRPLCHLSIWQQERAKLGDFAPNFTIAVAQSNIGQS